MPHLLVDISGHGFGHLAQVAPVVGLLAEQQPAIRLTLRSSLPEAVVRNKVHVPFDYVSTELDRGMLMHDALRVDADASCAWYREFHAGFDRRADAEAARLRALAPDLLLADIPYLSLEAAGRAGVPSVALCSLNWADIFSAYCHERRDDSIRQQMLAAYNRALHFLQPAPSMPMPGLDNAVPIGPIAQRGQKRRAELAARAGRPESDRFVLVSLGGIGTDLPAETLPQLAGVNWILPESMRPVRSDHVSQSQFSMPYIDLLASVDLVLTKTGYGALVEAVLNRVPLLCIERPGWPEEPELFAWCRQHGSFESTWFDALGSSAFVQRITRLLDSGRPDQLRAPNGHEQAAAIIVQQLDTAG